MKALLYGFMLLLLLFVTGCIPLTDEYGNRVDIVRLENQEKVIELSGPMTKTTLLKAQVKGSIYETGEMMSVFGTCLDADGMPLISGTYATFSSWYPNGTQYIENISMEEIEPGYYLYGGLMQAVQGTYLTEMICHVNGSDETAKAWGEWQNPYWVKKISNISVDIANLSEGLENLSKNTENWFNITWINQNETNILVEQAYENLTQQLIYVASVANESVDRNDSLIVQYLINLTNLLPENMTGKPIDFVEDAERVVYWTNWDIVVETYDGAGKKIQYPDSYCTITTSYTGSHQMTPSGSQFKYSEFINRRDGFTWVVTCYWT